MWMGERVGWFYGYKQEKSYYLNEEINLQLTTHDTRSVSYRNALLELKSCV